MTNHDDHTSSTPIGPDERTAPRVKRFAVAGAAALLLGLGGAGAAYAVGGGGAEPDPIEYGTIVESPTQADPSASVADREDCPEKSGGATAPEGETSPGSPSEAPADTPDTSTL